MPKIKLKCVPNNRILDIVYIFVSNQATSAMCFRLPIDSLETYQNFHDFSLRIFIFCKQRAFSDIPGHSQLLIP